MSEKIITSNGPTSSIGSYDADRDLLAALAKAREVMEKGENEEGMQRGFLTAEYAAAEGIGLVRARRKIAKLIELGHVKPAMVYRTNMWGIGQHRTGYAIVEDDDGK